MRPACGTACCYCKNNDGFPEPPKAGETFHCSHDSLELDLSETGFTVSALVSKDSAAPGSVPVTVLTASLAFENGDTVACDAAEDFLYLSTNI